ncbi:MAG TPA: FtsK/SpoIIIE domain-containing protein [Leptolyngbyaceae cyanobacterium]
MKELLKTNALSLTVGAFTTGIICTGVSLSGSFDAELQYCDPITNPCTQISVPIWLKQPPPDAKFVRVEPGTGAIRFLASIGAIGGFGFCFIASLVAAQNQRLIDEEKAIAQIEERMKQQVLVQEEVQKVAVAAEARVSDFKRRFFDAINMQWLIDNPEAARVFGGQRQEPKPIEQVEEPELLQEPEAEVVEEKIESPQPEQAKASESQALTVLKILRTNIEPLAEARLKHVKTYEGAAFNRHLYKGQGGTQWICALDGKAASLLQVELELEQPPIIQTVAGGVAVDVPRSDRVTFHYSDYAKQLSKTPTLPVGIDLEGKLVEITLDPVQGTNVLVGGTTRSGKSTWQTAAIASLTARFTKTEVALLVVDGKRTEFTWLNGSSHLLKPIAREPVETLSLLEFAYEEMVSRQEGFGAVGARNLVEYNDKSARGKKPVICLFADELGNVLNALAKKEKEAADEYLNQISSQGIAAGIFLIPATQKPVADDIPSKTKSNCSTRICFRVEGYRDSMVVLNSKGGENLLGAGDLLIISPQIAGTQRLQALLIETPVLSPNLQAPAPTTQPKPPVQTEPGDEEDKEQVSTAVETCETEPEADEILEVTERKKLFDKAIERVAEICRSKQGDVLKARDLNNRVSEIRQLFPKGSTYSLPDAIRDFIFPEVVRQHPDIKLFGSGSELGIFYDLDESNGLEAS